MWVDSCLYLNKGQQGTCDPLIGGGVIVELVLTVDSKGGLGWFT